MVWTVRLLRWRYLALAARDIPDPDKRYLATNATIRNARATDRKSLLALRGVGPECEAESVRFHGRRVTKVGPEVKRLPPEDWGPLKVRERTMSWPSVRNII